MTVRLRSLIKYYQNTLGRENTPARENEAYNNNQKS